MKNFICQCGNRVFFENTFCSFCGKRLGYSPQTGSINAYDLETDKLWHNLTNGLFYKPCRHYTEYNVCNWMLPAESSSSYCLSCNLNEMIPAITHRKKRRWWASMETAKRRLVVTLLKLKLSVINRQQSPDGLAFAFLEDKRRNPGVKEEFVATGHDRGLITVNLAEADDASREQTRVEMGEVYRTLLGHFRHESGHFYFDRLLAGSPLIDEFRQLFGDETTDYQAALADYYRNPPAPGRAINNGFISQYAQSHPLEDWAECWAHYLHMVDTLETAAEAGMVNHDFERDDIEKWLTDWTEVAIDMNSLNRSMGLQDAYPFVLAEPTLTKIRFVHRVVNPTRATS